MGNRSPPVAALIVGLGNRGTGAWPQPGAAVEFVATPASASLQPGRRHGKSSIPSSRLLHAVMVLSGGDVADPLLDHVRQAARRCRGRW
jgi:hypothetical protein